MQSCSRRKGSTVFVLERFEYGHTKIFAPVEYYGGIWTSVLEFTVLLRELVPLLSLSSLFCATYSSQALTEFWRDVSIDAETHLTVLASFAWT